MNSSIVFVLQIWVLFGQLDFIEPISRNNRWRCSIKNAVQACNFIKKRLYHKCFQLFYRTPPVAASAFTNSQFLILLEYSFITREFIPNSTHEPAYIKYRVHKSCSCKVFSLQEFEQNGSRTSCSSSNYCTNFREKQVKKKEIKNKSVWDLGLKEEKTACRTAVRRRI